MSENNEHLLPAFEYLNLPDVNSFGEVIECDDEVYKKSSLIDSSSDQKVLPVKKNKKKPKNKNDNGTHSIAGKTDHHIRINGKAVFINNYDERGLTSLHLAVMAGLPNTIRDLILRGAKPELPSPDGNTPLHLAAQLGYRECARALTDQLDEWEQTFCSFYPRPPQLPQDLELKNLDGETCLHIAARCNRAHVAELLLDLGADLEARELLSGSTPLLLAIQHRSKKVIHLLLTKYKPNLDACTYGGETAYKLCLMEKMPEFVGWLVRLGAEPKSHHVSRQKDNDDDDDD